MMGRHRSKLKQHLLRHWLDVTLLGIVLLSVVMMSSARATADDGNGKDDDDPNVSVKGSFTIVATTQKVGIDIMPFRRHNIIILRPWFLIPVAILSTSNFNAPAEIDTSSLTFGRTGAEDSLVCCLPFGLDVNCDGFKDQICWFRATLTGFQPGDREGILQGFTDSGTPVEGRDSVWIIPWGWHYW